MILSKARLVVCGAMVASFVFGASAQDLFNTSPSFAQEFDSGSLGLARPEGIDQVEARAMVSLKIPFGGVANSYEETQPRLSFNIGVARHRDWLNPHQQNLNGNVFEFGTTFDEHRYFVANGNVLSVDNSDTNAEYRRQRTLLIGVALLAGAVTAGSIIGLRESVEDAFGVD